MKRKELIESIKKAKKVYVYTVWSKHDGTYVRVFKNDLLDLLKCSDDSSTEYGAKLHDDLVLLIDAYSF